MERLPPKLLEKLAVADESYDGMNCWKYWYVRSKRYAPDSQHSDFRHACTLETRALRVLWVYLRPERIWGYGLSVKCGNKWCHNPFHYMKGVAASDKAYKPLPAGDPRLLAVPRQH